MEKVDIGKHDPEKRSLEEEFPPYLSDIIKDWIKMAFEVCNYYETNNYYEVNENEIKKSVVNEFGLRTRKSLSAYTDYFIESFIRERDDTLFLINHLLEKAGSETCDGLVSVGGQLEAILSLAGSAYSAAEEGGKWSLYYRVSRLTKKDSETARKSDEYLESAWKNCYGINPDYNKVVIESINSIEGVLKEHYFPNDNRPQLGKFLKNLEKGEKSFSCLGIEMLDEKGKEIIPLLKNLVQYRGNHKSGTGKDATREIAIYALNTAIWFWNLHNQK